VSEVALQVERLLARALRAADPVAALQTAAEGSELPESVRSALARVDPDGVRMTALITSRLRFERLMQGSRSAAEWFESDPAAFTAAFKRYQSAVAPTATFPSDEGRLFEAWRGEEPAS
jgi:hypothetical protein